MRQKKLIILTIPFLLLTACNKSKSEESPSAESQSEEESIPVELEEDTRPGYVFDDSSNENGSMSYEIFVRSFYDSDGNGIGDLNGVKEKLPYLSDMGFKTLWLMPINPSPSYHGYDVSDFYGINREYGTMEDFDALVAEAKKYNIDIMIDMVLNHSSIENPWLMESYVDYMTENTAEDSKADWYVWSDKSFPGASKYRELYVESRFSSTMPEFNFDSKGFRKEVDSIFKFWIKDHGVKGFRLDAVLYYYYEATEKNNEALSFLKETAAKYDPNFYMVGECWKSENIVLNYYKSGIDSLFNFNAAINGSSTPGCGINTVAKGTQKATLFTKGIEAYEKTLHENSPNSYSSYFLTNHDVDRASRYLKGDNAKVAASIYTLLPGTPYMYYGEEIELLGVRNLSPDDGTDVMRRLPMIWSKDNKTGECGFPEKSTEYYLGEYDQVENGVDDCLIDGYSLVNHYKKLIHIRNKYPFLKHGIFTSMIEELNIKNTRIVAYKISLGEEYIIVITNVNDYNVEFEVGNYQIVDEINTKRLLPSLENGVLKLGGKSTVILK